MREWICVKEKNKKTQTRKLEYGWRPTDARLLLEENFDQAISEHRKLAEKELLLFERQPSNDIGAANGSEVNGWTRLSLAVDSGACAAVANPELLPNYIELWKRKERGRASASRQLQAMRSPTWGGGNPD